MRTSPFTAWLQDLQLLASTVDLPLLRMPLALSGLLLATALFLL